MKQISKYPERILLLIILVLVVFNLMLKQCSPLKQEAAVPIVSITKDTIWQIKVDTFKVQTLRYKTVYVDKNDVSNVVDDRLEISDISNYKAAKVYKDTLSNDDIEIYSYNLVNGRLLDSQLSYKLKVPREITITKTITHPKTFSSGLYLFSEIGGNTSTLDNISLGLQYNRKGHWFASYRLNVNALNNPTHNIGVGMRLF